MSYVEIIYIDCEDSAARKTGLFYEWETPEATWAAFRALRPFDVGPKDAAFLLDYYNRKGDLADTIGITPAKFRSLTGQRVESNDHYRKTDSEFWSKP